MADGLERCELPRDKDVIVFDGKCVYCSGFAQFVARWDKTDRFVFVTAHSEVGRELYLEYDLDPDLMETNIVIVAGVPYVKMAAFSAAMKAIGWPWKFASILDVPPSGVMNWIYDHIAKNRYRFGRQSCPMPSPELKAKIVA